MMKLFKRYFTVASLVFLCFFSAFLSLYNGLLSTSQTSRMIKERNRYAYNSELRVFINTTSSISPDLLYQLVSTVDKGNIYIEDMRIYFDDLEGLFKPKVILKQNEKLSLPINNNPTQLPNGNIVISDNLINRHKAVSLHNNKLNIYETINTEDHPYATNIIDINAIDYFRAFPDALNGLSNISLTVASNEINPYIVYEEIERYVNKEYPDINITSTEINTSKDPFSSSINSENMISVGLFFFALINTLIISYYWVIVRRHEIAIRKAFGATNLRIIKMMICEFGEIICSSALFALIVQVVIAKMQNQMIGSYDSVFIIVGLLMSVIIANLIVMIIPVRYILSVKPAEGVKL